MNDAQVSRSERPNTYPKTRRGPFVVSNSDFDRPAVATLRKPHNEIDFISVVLPPCADICGVAKCTPNGSDDKALPAFRKILGPLPG